MSVKSFFVPKTALQGEEIPVHVIWEKIEFHRIRIALSSFLELKEVYNVAKKNIKKEQQSVIIKQPEVDGYLGMIFQSKQLEKVRQDAWLVLTFLDRNGGMIERRQARIRLFRPNIIVEEEIPNVIKVDLEKGVVNNRIKMRNVGDGTAIVRFETTKDSEVRRKLPKSIREFRKEFHKDAKRNLSKVQKEYPSYSLLVEHYIQLLKNPMKGKRYLKDMENVLAQLMEGLEADEDFGWAFIEALGAAFMKNVHLITIFENFLEYLSSVATSKIVIFDPLEVVSVFPETKELAMKVVTTDLVGGNYPEINLPKIKIISNQQGEVPIHRLVEWRRSHE